MAFNIASAYGINTAKCTADTSAANGAVLVDVKSGSTLAQVAGKYYKITRVFGRISGDWTLNKWNGTTNTAIGAANAGNDNLDIPGLNFDTGLNESPRITGTDASPELYIQYALCARITG